MVRYCDPIARLFILEFQKAVPGLSKAASVWSYPFAHGARHQAQATTARSERLLTRKNQGRNEHFRLAAALRRGRHPRAGAHAANFSRKATAQNNDH